MREFLRLCLVGCVAVILSGCTTGMSPYKTEVIASQTASMNHISVHKADGRLVVKGKVKAKHGHAASVPRYIRVDVLNAAGKVTSSKEVPHTPRMLTRTRSKKAAHFVAEFGEIPEADSRIRFSFVR